MANTSISIYPQYNSNQVTVINCGTSSPRLGGTIDISSYTNLNSFTCVSNDIISFQGFADCPNLTNVFLTDNKIAGNFNTVFPNFSNRSNMVTFGIRSNKITGTIPSLSGLSNLVYFGVQDNQFTGTIPSLSGLTELDQFWCYYNYLTGSIPSLQGLIKLRYFYCSEQLGTTKLTGSIPSLSTNTALAIFSCTGNQLTGSIPSLSGLNNLRNFYCNENQLTGTIPSLSGLNNLQDFRCSNNQLTGSIPALNGLSALQTFRCFNNQLINYAGGSVPHTLGHFEAYNNQLNQSSVDAILSALVAANRTTGTRILNLGGTGNAAPTGQGLTDKATLISRGWSVTTN